MNIIGWIRKTVQKRYKIKPNPSKFVEICGVPKVAVEVGIWSVKSTDFLVMSKNFSVKLKQEIH